MAMSSVEAGYVVVAGYYAQVLWIKSDIELHFILTNLQLADILSKPLAEPSLTRLVVELGFCSGGGGGGSVDVVSVVSVTLEGTSADAVRALKIWFLSFFCLSKTRLHFPIGTQTLNLNNTLPLNR
ncbi:hypothetical protein Tco_0317708 [Tanacetum coccineum]